MSRDIDVAKVMGELRAGIRKGRAAVVHPQNGTTSEDTAHYHPAAAAEHSSDNAIAADIASLHSGYDIVRPPFYSHRRTMSRAIIAAKNLARELLMQILVRQVVYNGANARVVTHLRREIESLRSELEQMQAQAEIEKASIRAELQAALATVADERKRELNLTNFDSGYFQFEQQHRGSEADIVERQRSYVAWYEGQSDVLDIGCGRGEFLELLRQAGVSHQGVDANPEMVAHCQRKGLEVVCGDGIEYLDKLPDRSLGGIFCAQVIEHLEPALVIALVHLCHSKLRSGGVLIFETPNPGCLMVFAESFYKDLAHIRPYHPAGVKFLIESAGFEGTRLEFSSPVNPSIGLPKLNDSTVSGVEDFNRGIERLNNLVYGFQDYAVIGRKGTNQDSGDHLSAKT